MANWQFKLDFTEESCAYDKGEMTLQQMAGALAKKLTKMKPSVNFLVVQEGLDEFPDIQDVIEEFARLSEEEDITVEDFDDVLDLLYDWGDIAFDSEWNGRKMCWITH